MRLIDADAPKGHFLNGGEDYYSGYAFHHAIDHIPTVDAVPMVRAKWEWNDHNGYYYCEKCGGISPRENQDGEYCDCPPFCPYCGAKMAEV